MCLDLRKIKVEPLQVPIIYHIKLFKLINLIIQSLDYASSTLTNIMKDLIPINDIFVLLAEPDIYSSNGVLPELNFILKR